MKKISSKNVIYQYGFLTGVVAITWGIIQFIMGTHYENDVVSQIVGSIILITGIVLGQLAFRKENGGLVSFSECLKVGVGISLVQAILGLLYYFLLTNFIEPDFNQIDSLKSLGVKTLEFHTGSYAAVSYTHLTLPTSDLV